MTDLELQHYLRENGYAPHVIRGGRAGLLRRWREFVEQVERGYTLGIEDYRNDLDIRGILALIEGALTPAEAEELRMLDERLKGMLVPVPERIWESAPGDPFWDFGIPRNAGPELLADLRSE